MTDALQVSHAHVLLEYQANKVDISSVIVLLEYDYPGALEVSNVFAYLEISGEPTGAEIYSVLIEGNSSPEGMGESLFGDRSAWDTGNHPERHARDIDEGTFGYHIDPLNPPGTGTPYDLDPEPLGIVSPGTVTEYSRGDHVHPDSGGGGGFENPMTTEGDIIVGGASGSALRLGIGSSGQVLTVSGGVPVWANPSGVSMFSEAESLSSESLGVTFTESDVEV
jgi:hypothetical protein